MKYCKNVTLRERKIANGKLSLYLDYYPCVRDKVTMKIIRREYLGIYIYANPKNKMEKDFNRKMREKAETIRCQRYESVVCERWDLFFVNLYGSLSQRAVVWGFHTAYRGF